MAALGGAEAPRAAGVAARGGASAATAAMGAETGSVLEGSAVARPGTDGAGSGGRAARTRGAGARTARTGTPSRTGPSSRGRSDDPLRLDAVEVYPGSNSLRRMNNDAANDRSDHRCLPLQRHVRGNPGRGDSLRIS